LFGVKIVVDAALEQDEYIYFNAGNHVQTVCLKYRDFKKLVNPRVTHLTQAPRRRAA
jgi:Ala-tRNA(Pro) deacylase